ncbi:restriction endonuclease subunit S [Pseudomonas juntendi]|uniref:restriction endonuclease subunit S n=1 Tax=Pseudomonas juntendi TaxID=2666183 RepID=UPI001FFD763C|nr:restriction endonuclease subunit S [Pseudomonas juntendi]MCK2111204.1 restriction endonuclease subunit S [Pseudomonas juntendi]
MSAEVKTGYKQTEVGVIPEDWNIVQLGDLFSFKNGLNKSKEFFGYGTPIVNYMDVFQKSGLRNNDIQGRVDVNRSELKAYEVRKGDVFFTRTSETVEEVGVASVALEETQDTVFSGFVLRGRPVDESLDDEYKKYCFSAPYFRKQVTSRASYTTRALTNGRSLSTSLLVRPPLVEQKSIASVLSDIDALISRLDQLVAKKRDIQQATMQQLLNGQRRLPEFSNEWEMKRLGDIADLYQPVTISARQLTDFGYPVYGANGVVGFFSEFNHDSPQVTVTCRGSTCGTVNRTVEKSWITGNAMVINCDKSRSINKEFLYFLLLGQDLSVCITGTGQPQIVRGPLANFELPIPSDLEEQRAIASILSDMGTELAALEARRNKAHQLKQGIMQELLTGRIRMA